jgi:hypothetical protein
MTCLILTKGSVTLAAPIRRFSVKPWGRRQDVAEAVS